MSVCVRRLTLLPVRSLLVNSCTLGKPGLMSLAISTLSGDPDNTCRLRKYKEHLLDTKKELSETRTSPLTLELDESDNLPVQLASLEKDVLNRDQEKVLSSSPPSVGASPATSDNKGVKRN